MKADREEKAWCVQCGAEMLATTAAANKGKCRRCTQPIDSEYKAAVVTAVVFTLVALAYWQAPTFFTDNLKNFRLALQIGTGLFFSYIFCAVLKERNMTASLIWGGATLLTFASVVVALLGMIRS